MSSFIIGIAGGTGSGKTTFTERILEQFSPSQIVHIAHDSYYHDLSTYGHSDVSLINFDHPDALETSLMVRHVQALRQGKPVKQPQYDFSTHRRMKERKLVEPRPVILIEGILIFSDPLLRKLFDLKVYIDADGDERVLRRLQRDITERGRTLDSFLTQYRSSVKPMHDQYVAPSKIWADVIIPRGGENRAAISMLISVVQQVLQSTHPLRD